MRVSLSICARFTLVSKLVFFAIICALHLPVQAQTLNWQSLLIGDEAAGMGGAYTSLYQDAAASGFYNPAAYVFQKSESISASVGVYKKFDLQYGNSSDLLSASLNMNRGFFRAVPASTSSTFRFSEIPYIQDVRFAFSILVPKHEEFSGDILRESNLTSRLNYSSESLWVGPSASIKVNPKSAIGLSIFYLAETMTVDRTHRSSEVGDSFYEFESRSVKNNHLLLLLGYQAELTGTLRFGLSASLQPLFVSGEGEREYIRFQSIDNSLNEVSERSLKSRLSRPAQISSGLSFQQGNFVFSGDIRWHGSLAQQDLEQSGNPYDFSVQQVINYSLGMNWQVLERLNFRCGLFTDFSPHYKDLRRSSAWQADHIDQYGFSANIAYKNKAIEYTFGGYYVGGQGDAWIPNESNFVRTQKNNHIFTMLVGVNYVTQ